MIEINGNHFLLNCTTQGMEKNRKTLKLFENKQQKKGKN